MRFRVVSNLVLVVSLTFCFAAGAQEVLPKELKGNISRPGTKYNVGWSLVVESQTPDGAIAGKFNFDGRSCQMDGLAFTGSYRDGDLQLKVPAARADCGPWEIKVKRTSAPGFEFEGTSTERSNQPATAYLKGG